ncbi:aryl-alcohol dehydrogenase [NADP+] [Dentipellis sp. KUC8613]|nr:aryl-alcohol dehydrogenase [NADP+] [Dentipellis sp. KUC8613]
MSGFPPVPKLPTPLGLYRPLSPLAGVRVSPLQLGAMSVGDKWNFFMGSMDKEQSFKLLDAYHEAGGNFIDTSANYQDEASEQFLGEWMEARGVRDQIVLATKYTHFYNLNESGLKQRVNFAGNNTKNMNLSLKASLKKLRTDYIDILYVHWWDWDTGVEEIMNSLHNLVASGKVLYLGISDTPAWIVSKANQYARDHGKTPFCIYQGQWNVLSRSFEREIIPMARAEGLALAPWDVLASGKIRTDAEEEERRKTGEQGRKAMGANWERSPDERKMCQALEKVAGEIGAKSIQAVAIAYVMQKTTHVFPIIGGRKVEHLNANIEALSIALSKDQIEYIESVLPFDPGFPYWLIGNGTSQGLLVQLTIGAQAQSWPLPQPIIPQSQ